MCSQRSRSSSWRPSSTPSKSPRETTPRIWPVLINGTWRKPPSHVRRNAAGLTNGSRLLQALGLCHLIHLRERDTDGMTDGAFYDACNYAFPRRHIACDVGPHRSGKCLVVLCAVGVERIAAHDGEQRAGRGMPAGCAGLRHDAEWQPAEAFH